MIFVAEAGVRVDLESVVVDGGVFKEAEVRVEDLGGEQTELFPGHTSIVETHLPLEGDPELVTKALDVMSVHLRNGFKGVETDVFAFHCDFKLVPIGAVVELAQSSHENLILVLVILRIFHLEK